MKKINIIIGLCAFSILVASCSKQLNKTPFDSISKEQSFKSVKDAKNWDVGLYATLRGNVYGIFTFSTDVQADQLNASLDYGNRNGFPHKWDGFLSDDYTIRDVWSGYYYAIANINVALAGFQEIKPENAADSLNLKHYTGDEYLARAYYYFELVQRWAKSYNPSSATQDLGVPLIIKYELNGLPARATVDAVYKQILSDISMAKTMLADVAGSLGSSKFNVDVAYALEARVKLNMQDWQGAYAAANQLISSGRYPLVTTQGGLDSMWHYDAPNETIMQLYVSAPSELANTNNIYIGYNSGNNSYDPDFIPSQWVVDMFPSNDFRLNTYFMKDSVLIQGAKYGNIYLVNKYPGNPALYTSASTNYEQAPKIFRIGEMYLIAAEAEANIGGASESIALSLLNTLRMHRGYTVALTGLAGASLKQAVMDERFRELAFEGFRLDDLKRWNMGFTRKDPQNINIIVTGADFNTKTVAAGADKFVWGIPANDMTINPNLKGEQNPGW
ncbi:MAG TPA: RagB/SusD family nutrient uptake outer membrane protein [Arachidicoccus soli]|nr:RagB/SusD family nutrient uptake outer membrane protein [Arachidicoccus soli]